MQILTLGGGGFSFLTPSDPTIASNPLDTYLLSLAKKRNPKICLLPTASGDSPVYIEKFLAAFPKRRAQASVLSLFRRDNTDLEKHLLSQHIIFVGGGNTANALALWRLHGLDRILKRAYRQGIVLAGISAGMNCWFQACSTDSFGPLAPFHDGLGLLPGAACPHFDAEPTRRPTLLKWVAKGTLPSTHAADDHAALHWLNGKLHRCLKSTLSAGCYHITKSPTINKPHIQSLPTDLL